MTFMSPVNERIEIKQEQVIRKENGKLFYQADLEAVYMGEKSEGEISVPNIVRQKFELLTGFNSIKLKMPVVTKLTEYSAAIKIDDKTLERKFTIQPVKEWTVYFVQHTHTDIGYTRPQTEILPEHLRFIDYALDYL